MKSKISETVRVTKIQQKTINAQNALLHLNDWVYTSFRYRKVGKRGQY